MVATFFSMSHPIHPKAGVIRELKAALRASNRTIAKKAGVPYNYINRYLDGLMKPQDDTAFDRMEHALHEIEREMKIAGTLPVGYGAGLKVDVLKPEIDVISNGVETDTGISNLDLNLFSIKPKGKPWGRKATSLALTGLIERGDVIVIDSRKADPGHVVEAYISGEPIFGILAGSGRTLRLRFTATDFEDLPIEEKDLRGVVIARKRTMDNDVVSQTEYPHGMTLNDKS
jgi:hypothetical protein